MAVSRRLYLLPLLCCLPLAAEEEGDKKIWNCNWDSSFGAYAQANAPLRDLKDAMDRRTGFGLGVQWTHDHSDYHASRTRLEYNVFPEGNPVGPQQTQSYAKNYLLSFDHLFRFNGGPTNVYAVAGLGGVRWVLDQTTGSATQRLTTTKVAVAGGIGIQISGHVNLETRYVLSGIQRTFDSNMLQVSLGWKF